MISFKDIVVFVSVICLACRVVLPAGEVTLVTRNVTDNFRVGENGCVKDASVCTNHSATCEPSSGLCLCRDSNFRNPVIVSDGSLKYGQSYGCVSSINIRLGVDNALCHFEPFQVISYNHHDPVTQFNYAPFGKPENVQSCSLRDVWAKFPDNFTAMKPEFLNESYVDLTILNNVLHFKWRRSVPELQGTIITFNLRCTLSPPSYVNKCLRAKILGTWPAGTKSNLQTTPSIQPNTPTQNGTSSNSPTTQPLTTQSRSITASTAASSDGNDSNMTIIIVAVVVPIVLLIVLIVIIWLLCRRKKRQRTSSLGSSRKKHANSAPSSKLKELSRTDSNLRGPAAYIDAPEKDTTQTFTGPGDTVKSHTNAGYSTPDIKRIEINGDVYALPNKEKSNKKPKDDTGLSYMDPSALVTAKQEKDKASDDTGQPTEYADIVGFMKPAPDK